MLECQRNLVILVISIDKAWRSCYPFFKKSETTPLRLYDVRRQKFS